MEKRIVIILCLLLTASLQVRADGKAFKIELLVFAHDTATNEVFDQYQSEIDWPSRVAVLEGYQQASSDLQGIYGRLRRSAGYRPLLMLAWTQTVEANSLGTAVQIQNPAGDVNGFFRLQRGHYLHMIADLEFSPDGSQIFRLNEKRRCKFNELHYLDHPKFGVIARVSPAS